jgi:hypothetical protein
MRGCGRFIVLDTGWQMFQENAKAQCSLSRCCNKNAASDATAAKYLSFCF